MWRDSETIIDYINYEYIADIIVGMAEDPRLTPATIGLYGDWGSGKSSLMAMAQDKIETKKDNSFVCVRFNGWLFEGYEDAKTALCTTILDTIYKKPKLLPNVKRKITDLLKKLDGKKLLGKGIQYGVDFALTGGVGTVADLSIQSLISLLKNKTSNVQSEDIEKILEIYKGGEKKRKEIQDFHKNFEEILKESKIDHLVVFVDELDRCTPETILDIFAAIRLFLYAKGTAFVIGADERLIEYAVKTKYAQIEGNNMNIGKEYLEKMVQYPVRIPILNEEEVEQYISCLLMEHELDEQSMKSVVNIVHSLPPTEHLTYSYLVSTNSDLADTCKESLTLAHQIATAMAKPLNGNPRQCKRFMNMIQMREKMASIKGLKIKRNVLAKLQLAEYFKPALYEKILNLENLKYLEEIEHLGEGLQGVDELNTNIFSEQLQDEWIRKWFEIPVKLSSENLAEYYYLAKSDIPYMTNINVRLSSVGNNCLQLLSSPSEIEKNNGLKILQNLSISEQKEILKSMMDKLNANEELDNDTLKVIGSIAERCKGIHPDIVVHLKGIPLEKYKQANLTRVGVLSMKLCEPSRQELLDYIKSDPQKMKKIEELLKK
jgi:Predicted P-loop ATPase